MRRNRRVLPTPLTTGGYGSRKEKKQTHGTNQSTLYPFGDRIVPPLICAPPPSAERAACTYGCNVAKEKDLAATILPAPTPALPRAETKHPIENRRNINRIDPPTHRSQRPPPNPTHRELTTSLRRHGYPKRTKPVCSFQEKEGKKLAYV